MQSMDRRAFLRSALGGAAVVTVATTAGLTLISTEAEAAPVAAAKNLPEMMEKFTEDAQVVVVNPRRARRYHRRAYRRWRRRHWRCWWSRGRRVCGWRYW